jgi:predicted MFS family arabinose efflux permease
MVVAPKVDFIYPCGLLNFLHRGMHMKNKLQLITSYYKSPEGLLLLMSLAVPLSMQTWMALLNNFTIQRASFTGAEIGVLQSLREVPGFLAFTVVFLLPFLREQKIILLATGILGIGTAITGFFPSVIGLYLTTVLMSIGFHYNETMNQSLTLQWVDKDKAAPFMGLAIAVRSFAAIGALALIWLGLEFFNLSMEAVYILGGGATLFLVICGYVLWPKIEHGVPQNKNLFLRSRYWLYYALTFMAGARRQIFVVFAGFLMVEKFHFTAADIVLMFIINSAINIFLAPAIGRAVRKWGERKTLTCEYIGLVAVFMAYAFVDDPIIAATLYVVDHLFFSMAIAIKTYFQKIAHPADMAATAGVSFTINHIAAVILPAVLGVVWVHSQSAVFMLGAGFAILSLMFARLIPADPSEEKATLIFNRAQVQQHRV